MPLKPSNLFHPIIVILSRMVIITIDICLLYEAVVFYNQLNEPMKQKFFLILGKPTHKLIDRMCPLCTN